MALLTITPSDFCFLPVTLFYADVEVAVQKRKVFPLGNTAIILLNWKLRLPHSLIGLLRLLNQLAKKGVTVLAQ